MADMMDQSRFLPPGQAEPLPLHAETATLQPRDPRVAFDSQAVRKLNDHEWTSLSNDLYQSVLTSLTARGALGAEPQGLVGYVRPVDGAEGLALVNSAPPWLDTCWSWAWWCTSGEGVGRGLQW